MAYSVWQAGTPISSPVYLDTNVLVGAVIRNQPIYLKAAQIVGALLSYQARILVSVLTVEESLWALAEVSYKDIYGHGAGVRFSQRIYQRHLEEIFERHGARMQMVSEMLRDWSEAGAALEVVPKTEAAFLAACGRTPRYMEQYQLTTADAMHLALAEDHGATLVTSDSKLAKVGQQAACQTPVVHVTP